MSYIKVKGGVKGGGLVLAVVGFTATLSAATEESVEASITLFDRILQGGFAMVPLGLCSLFLFFLVFYCWKETQRKKFIPETVLQDAIPGIRERAFEEVRNRFKDSDSVLGRTLFIALAKANPQLVHGNKEKVEVVLSESLEAEENNIGQWINYLNVIASVAPMIGLLGTVSGMISAFDTMAAGGMGRPELLAGNIGEALITTATGLVIGIPAMIAYFILRNRLNNAMIATFQAASNITDGIGSDESMSVPDCNLQGIMLN